MEIPEGIRARYFRKTITSPDGGVFHHGDCDVYLHRVCTCGLLLDLLPIPDAGGIYEKFDEERNAQSLAFDRLSQGG